MAKVSSPVEEGLHLLDELADLSHQIGAQLEGLAQLQGAVRVHLERVNRFHRELQDWVDLQIARAALEDMAEHGGVPWEKVKDDIRS